jgi:hypothetical protein
MGIKNVFISSSQRENYTTTDSANIKIKLNESMYGGYKLKSVSVPNTMYTIEQGINNWLGVRFPGPPPANTFPGPGTSFYDFYAPNLYVSDGNTLAALIQSTLNGMTGLPPADLFTVIYNNNTAKLTFSSSGSPFFFDLSTNYETSLAPILGFTKGIYSSTTGVAPYTLTSNIIINFTRTPVVFIKIAEFNNYIQNGPTGVCYTYMLPNNVSSLYFIDSFFDQTGVLNQFAKELNISLRDEKDRIINIQNIDWYMCLESVC